MGPFRKLAFGPQALPETYEHVGDIPADAEAVFVAFGTSSLILLLDADDQPFLPWLVIFLGSCFGEGLGAIFSASIERRLGFGDLRVLQVLFLFFSPFLLDVTLEKKNTYCLISFSLALLSASLIFFRFKSSSIIDILQNFHHETKMHKVLGRAF